MKITLEQSGGIYTLHSYRDATIVVRPPNAAPDDEDKLLRLKESCLLSARQLITDWPPQQLSELTAEHLQAIRELNPELLLLGSGAKMQFPAATQLAALVSLGIGYEVMDTAAACRTYNVLVAEGRKVVAALFAR
jgi:uncharacterized protein